MSRTTASVAAVVAVAALVAVVALAAPVDVGFMSFLQRTGGTKTMTALGHGERTRPGLVTRGGFSP
jgi:hypothetical protein